MTIVTIPFFNTAKHAINWDGGHGGQKLTILDRGAREAYYAISYVREGESRDSINH